MSKFAQTDRHTDTHTYTHAHTHACIGIHIARTYPNIKLNAWLTPFTSDGDDNSDRR